MVWTVAMLPEAETELGKLSANEQEAILHAAEQLNVNGPNLGHPHSSAIRGAV